MRAHTAHAELRPLHVAERAIVRRRRPTPLPRWRVQAVGVAAGHGRQAFPRQLRRTPPPRLAAVSVSISRVRCASPNARARAHLRFARLCGARVPPLRAAGPHWRKRRERRRLTQRLALGVADARTRRQRSVCAACRARALAPNRRRPRPSCERARHQQRRGPRHRLRRRRRGAARRHGPWKGWSALVDRGDAVGTRRRRRRRYLGPAWAWRLRPAGREGRSGEGEAGTHPRTRRGHHWAFIGVGIAGLYRPAVCSAAIDAVAPTAPVSHALAHAWLARRPK